MKLTALNNFSFINAYPRTPTPSTDIYTATTHVPSVITVDLYTESPEE